MSVPGGTQHVILKNLLYYIPVLVNAPTGFYNEADLRNPASGCRELLKD